MMPLGMVEIGESGVIGTVKDSRVALSQSMAMRVLVN